MTGWCDQGADLSREIIGPLAESVPVTAQPVHGAAEVAPSARTMKNSEYLAMARALDK